LSGIKHDGFSQEPEVLWSHMFCLLSFIDSFVCMEALAGFIYQCIFMCSSCLTKSSAVRFLTFRKYNQGACFPMCVCVFLFSTHTLKKS